MNIDLEFALRCIKPILAKLPVTLYMTIIATILALVGGISFAIIIKKNIVCVSSIFKFINSFLKGIPVLIILYILYYSMPTVLVHFSEIFGFTYDIKNPPKMIFGIFAFGITYIPYMCDMVITAYDTIPKGQMEACYSMGFTTFQGMKRIVVPQMIVVAIPIFGNHFVNILKATSLAYMVTIIEMMGAAKNFATGEQKFLETYLVAALIYWIICIAFDKIFAFIEANSGKYRKTIASDS